MNREKIEENGKMREKYSSFQEWAAKLPKVELHCHLDGSLPWQTVKKLAGRAEISIPGDDAALRAMLTVPSGCRSLKEYLECFSLPLSCLQTYDALCTGAYELAREAALENTLYMEVRFAPAFSAHDGFTAEDVVRGVRDGLLSAEKEFGIKTGILLCGMRHFEPEKNLEIPRLAEKFMGNGVCGIDLAGDEKAFPPELHREMFRLAADMGIPFTIHAGECGSWENVCTAAAMGAKRIGHGIAMAGHEEAERLCRERGIAIEMCPTSNFQTKAVEREENYPVRRFLDLGLNVTVNTDNRTVSGTTLTKELLLLHDRFGVSGEEVREMMKNAARAAFAPATVREEVERRIDSFAAAGFPQP